MKKVSTILISSGLLLLIFAFTSAPNLAWGYTQNGEPVSPPGTLEEAREKGERMLETAINILPGIIERIWEEEVLPAWRRMWDWAEVWWGNTIWPWVRGFWEGRIKPPIEEEVEKRKEIVEERIEEEKEELEGKIIPKAIKSLWEKFEELIK